MSALECFSGMEKCLPSASWILTGKYVVLGFAWGTSEK